MEEINSISIFEAIKQQADKIEYIKKQDFIKCLENIKGAESIIENVKLKGVPSHLMLSDELEKNIPKDNRLRSFLTVVPCSNIEPKLMVFYWHKEGDFLQQKIR